MRIRPQWLSEAGPDSDVAVSTRARLARNLSDMPFPWRASPLQAKAATESIMLAAERSGGVWQDADVLSAERLSREDLFRLIEWRTASLTWAEGGQHRKLIVGRGGVVSAMVNEEDHLRVQAIHPGFQPEAAFEYAQRSVRSLSASLSFASDDEIGYLTAALTNAGTGMRLSVILHLPALAASGYLNSKLEVARELGSSVRGLYGEGTAVAGSFFQLSNRRTFRLHESDILAGVSSSARHLITAEREARAELYRGEDRLNLAEETYEALADLQRRDPDPMELLELISVLRLAAAEKIIRVDAGATAEWLAIAGVFAVLANQPGTHEIRYEAARRSATLRQVLRSLLRHEGTFTGEIAG